MTRRDEELPGFTNLAIIGTPLFTAPVDSTSGKGDLATIGRRFFSSIGLAVLIPGSEFQLQSAFALPHSTALVDFSVEDRLGASNLPTHFVPPPHPCQSISVDISADT